MVAFLYSDGVYAKCDTCGVQMPEAFESEREALNDARMCGWHGDEDYLFCDLCWQKEDDHDA